MLRSLDMDNGRTVVVTPLDKMGKNAGGMSAAVDSCCCFFFLAWNWNDPVVEVLGNSIAFVGEPLVLDSWRSIALHMYHPNSHGSH